MDVGWGQAAALSEEASTAFRKVLLKPTPPMVLIFWMLRQSGNKFMQGEEVALT